MILVTGGAGYIGSHFVRHFLDKFPQEKVLIIDNMSEGHKESLPQTDRVVFLQEDVGNLSGMKDVLVRHPVDAVVHFASSCYVGESQKDPAKYFNNNVINGLKLFQAMEESNVRRCVFSSSCASYGDPKRLPMDETHPQDPINVYGLTKLILEKALKAYVDTRGWSYVALRYFNAAGADDSGAVGESHEPETHIIPLALQTAAGKRQQLEVFGDDYDTDDGTCIRDYIHVNDLAAAHSLALEKTRTAGVKEAFNLGTATGASVKQIIDLCKEVSGREINVKMSPRRSGDPPALVADFAKAKSGLGWQPRYDLRRIIETAWNWEQNRKY